MKAYKLNLDSLKKEMFKDKTIEYQIEHQSDTINNFKIDNKELMYKCKRKLKNNSEKIYVKYKDKYYLIEKAKIGICIECGLQKECNKKFEGFITCPAEIMFEFELDYIFKEIDEYEIVFGGDNENN